MKELYKWTLKADINYVWDHVHFIVDISHTPSWIFYIVWNCDPYVTSNFLKYEEIKNLFLVEICSKQILLWRGAVNSLAAEIDFSKDFWVRLTLLTIQRLSILSDGLVSFSFLYIAKKILFIQHLSKVMVQSALQ